MLYSAKDELFILMIEAVRFFIHNPTKSASLHSFHALMMYMLAEMLVKELRAVYEEYCCEMCLRFPPVRILK